MQILYTSTGSPNAQLEYVIFALIGLTVKEVVSVIGYPLIRNIRSHADREFTVFGKEYVFLARVFFQQLSSLVRCSYYLHRIETVQLIDGLKLHNLSSRKRRSFLARKLVLLNPICRSRIFKSRIFNGRIIRATAHYILQIINIVFSRNGLRLENYLAMLSANVKATYVSDALTGSGIHYNQILRFGILIATAPFYLCQHCIGLFIYRNNNPMIS